MEANWMDQGECSDKPPTLFFPSDGTGVEKAKKICAECIVKDKCLEYALKNRVDHGVWGGTSERQRRRILKARREEAKREQQLAGFDLVKIIQDKQQVTA